MTWRVRHREMHDALSELINAAKLLGRVQADEVTGRQARLACAAIDYADAVRALAGTERKR